MDCILEITIITTVYLMLVILINFIWYLRARRQNNEWTKLVQNINEEWKHLNENQRAGLIDLIERQRKDFIELIKKMQMEKNQTFIEKEDLSKNEESE